MLESVKGQTLSRKDSMAKMLKKINGHIVPVAQISLLLTILYFAVKAAICMGEIRQFTINNSLRITESKLAFEEDISYLDMNGCKPSIDNAKTIAILGVKSRN